MALTDIPTFLQNIKKYTKSVQLDNALYEKSKCENFLSDIDGTLTQDPAHAQRKALEHHRSLIVDVMKKCESGVGQSDVTKIHVSEEIPIDHESLEGLLDQDKLDHIKAKGGSMVLQWIPPNSSPPHWIKYHAET